jgi:hypothetical protein
MVIEKRYRRIDCINNFKAHRIPVPIRSSCVVCPYHSDKYWLWIYENELDDFEVATVLDEKIRNYLGINDEFFIHRSCTRNSDKQLFVRVLLF